MQALVSVASQEFADCKSDRAGSIAVSVGSTAGGAVILIKRLFLRVVFLLIVGTVFLIVETCKGDFAGFVIEAVDGESFATVEFKLNE